MKKALYLAVIAYSLCSCLTKRPSQPSFAFRKNSGQLLCSMTSGNKTIELRGNSRVPAGFVIDMDAVAIKLKGGGKWQHNSRLLGKYRIYRTRDNDDYSITLKWTEGDGMPLLKHIEYLSIDYNSDTGKQNLYTYYSGHNGELGDKPKCI